MSTYLQLCQDLRRELLIPGTGPATVASNTGQLDRLVHWIRDAYTELQNEQPNWRWMRGNFQILTTLGVPQYAFSDSGVTDADTATVISRFRRWWVEDHTTLIYLQTDGTGTRHAIPFLPWDTHRITWLLGNQPNGYPSQVSVDPQDRLRLGAFPSGVYVVQGEYQKGPQLLTADADVPEIPSRYHPMIVAMAMRKYAAAMAAPEVYAQARDIEMTHRSSLETDQLPPPRFAPPLS